MDASLGHCVTQQWRDEESGNNRVTALTLGTQGM